MQFGQISKLSQEILNLLGKGDDANLEKVLSEFLASEQQIINIIRLFIKNSITSVKIELRPKTHCIVLCIQGFISNIHNLWSLDLFNVCDDDALFPTAEKNFESTE